MSRIVRQVFNARYPGTKLQREKEKKQKVNDQRDQAYKTNFGVKKPFLGINYANFLGT